MAPRRSILQRIQAARLGSQRYDVLGEVFLEQSYGWLYEQLRPGTTVVDIGAYVGETAIYFAGHPGVSRVVAYEPVPRSFAEAQRNRERSPQRDKIELVNEAVAARPGQRRIRESFAIGSIETAYSRLGHRTGRTVGSTTLADALRGLTNVAVKCDAEGDEREIFADTVDLGEVYAMQIEFHDCLDELRPSLEAKGFDVRAESSADIGPFREVGFVHCTKR